MREMLLNIIDELKVIVSERKCSIELANKIESELDNLFKDDDGAIQEFVANLAQYRPSGGDYLLDINDLVKECRFIIDILEENYTNDEALILEKQIDEISRQLENFEKRRIFNDDVYRLFEEKRILQRKLSLAKNQETAILLEYPYPWDTGAPLPHVLSDGYRTFLIYYIGEHNPKWNPTDKEITNLDAGATDITALVEFINCYNYKFGGINDEVINGHPLYEHGLEAYEAHMIVNSKWLNEQEKINSVHSNYSHTLWENRKHYIFTFHDEIFECIADGYNVDIFKGKIHSVFSEAAKRLFS